MAHSVYFTAAEINCPTQDVALAYLEALTSSYERVGVFRSFTNGPIEDDEAFLELLAKVGRVQDAPRAWGSTRQAYVVSEEEAMNAVVERYTHYARDFNAVLVLGLLDSDPVLPGSLDRAGRAAAHLGTNVVMLVRGKDRSAQRVAAVTQLAAAEISKEHAPIVATVIVGGQDDVALEGHPSPIVHIGDDALGSAAGSSAENGAAEGASSPDNTGILDSNARQILLEAIAVGSHVVTPLSFTAALVEKARARRQRIVLPESEDDRILLAAAECLARGVADITLLGEPEVVRARAAQLGADISGAEIVSVKDAERIATYATEFAELRKKKGVTYEQAVDIVSDVSYFGTMMVHMGDADGMVSGAAHTTAHTIVPSFQIIKTKPGTAIVSSIFLLLMADRVFAYGDCAVNTNPTPQELANIAISSAETAAQFGVEPRVAMLSYSTGDSGKGPDVEAVARATQLARQARPDLLIEGPIQYDAAVDEAVAAKKLPDSPVAGRATVFVFPNLNAGNIGYKAVQRSAGAVAVGPVLQGLNKPVNDLSRGALVEDIVNTIVITAIQAQQGQATT